MKTRLSANYLLNLRSQAFTLQKCLQKLEIEITKCLISLRFPFISKINLDTESYYDDNDYYNVTVIGSIEVNNFYEMLNYYIKEIEEGKGEEGREILGEYLGKGEWEEGGVEGKDIKEIKGVVEENKEYLSREFVIERDDLLWDWIRDYLEDFQILEVFSDRSSIDLVREESSNQEIDWGIFKEVDSNLLINILKEVRGKDVIEEAELAILSKDIKKNKPKKMNTKKGIREID